MAWPPPEDARDEASRQAAGSGSADEEEEEEAMWEEQLVSKETRRSIEALLPVLKVRVLLLALVVVSCR